MKCHLRPNFVRIKQKNIRTKKYEKCLENLGYSIGKVFTN